MACTKIAITIDREMLEELDRMVARKVFPNRSRAIQEAVYEKIQRLSRSRLAEECARLDRAVERDLAEEGMPSEYEEWPEY